MHAAYGVGVRTSTNLQSYSRTGERHVVGDGAERVAHDALVEARVLLLDRVDAQHLRLRVDRAHAGLAAATARVVRLRDGHDVGRLDGRHGAVEEPPDRRLRQAVRQTPEVYRRVLHHCEHLWRVQVDGRLHYTHGTQSTILTGNAPKPKTFERLDNTDK